MLYKYMCVCVYTYTSQRRKVKNDITYARKIDEFLLTSGVFAISFRPLIVASVGDDDGYDRSTERPCFREDRCRRFTGE